MKKFLMKKLLGKLCIIAFLIYILVVIAGQQRTLASYNSQKEYYTDKIEEANMYNKTLLATRDNLDTKEYMETICREKLNMYSENEKVYININK